MKSISTLRRELYRTLDRDGWRKRFAVVYAPVADEVRVLKQHSRVYDMLVDHCHGQLVGIYDNDHYFPNIAKDLKQTVKEYRDV